MAGAEAVITIEGTEYALFIKSPLRKYPHMVNISTGEIPDGDQKPLLEKYLVQNGVSSPDFAPTTHSRIRQAISIARQSWCVQ